MKRAGFLVSLVLAAAVLAPSAFGQEKAQGFPDVPAADAKALEKLKQLGALAMPLANNTNVISVDFRAVADQVNDAALENLKPVGAQLVWLNLAGSKVTDAGLAQVAALKNLQRLHLEKTGVGDDGVAHLKALAELRYLNLYGTKVGDKSLAALKGLKNLQSLFLWQTSVTDAGAEDLQKALPTLYINRGWEIEKAKLPPPVPIEPPKKPDAPAAAKAINAKCPLSGKDIDPAATTKYKDQVIGFC
jgi:hypothetical protein